MNTKTLTHIAMIAAVYTVVSLVLAPFTYGTIQVRVAEALTMLPLIYAPSIWGVTLGCFLTNLIGAFMGTNPTGFIDAIIGTSATFLAAYGTYYFRDKKIKNIPILSILCPIILNFIFVGAELAYLFNPDNLVVGFLIQGTSVAIGETISVVLGYLLMNPMKRFIR
ncbi:MULTISPECIES: QueT transporter family protein [Terrabacteria group]|uniref:QueT transporter family protein n=1 Tax=Bacillati TaxID=1783272 RepID=UPI001C6F299C|nr:MULTISPECIES: QueT transporter family protein [Terrabacteria group]MBW9212522.1 QueT transporter family protein [Trueperella sp. zg.1013]